LASGFRKPGARTEDGPGQSIFFRHSVTFMRVAERGFFFITFDHGAARMLLGFTRIYAKGFTDNCSGDLMVGKLKKPSSRGQTQKVLS